MGKKRPSFERQLRRLNKKQAQQPHGLAPRNKQELIYVAIPTCSSRLTMGLIHFLSSLDRMSLDEQFPYAFCWRVMNGKRPVEYARNHLTRSFLELKQASRLLFVDEDMMPGPGALNILDVDADLVSGRAFGFDHKRVDPLTKKQLPPGLKPCIFDLNPKTGRFHPKKPDFSKGQTVFDADASGAACLLIKRHVLEDRRMWLPTKYVDHMGIAKDHSDNEFPEGDEDWAPPIWRTIYRPDGRILRGEDLDFTDRARKLGYSLKAHYGANYGHLKEVDLDAVADMAETITQRVTAAANKEIQNAKEGSLASRKQAPEDSGLRGDAGRSPCGTLQVQGAGGVLYRGKGEGSQAAGEQGNHEREEG